VLIADSLSNRQSIAPLSDTLRRMPVYRILRRVGFVHYPPGVVHTIGTVALVLVLLQPAPVRADEIKVWTARALATAGESFDLLISGSATVDEWIKEGRIAAATRRPIARSGIGVEVKAGARKPDISTVDAFKRALLEAKSIAYLRVGSGIYLADLFERLKIADAIAPKVTRPESDIVSELVAKGEIELGMTVITQIMTTPGVDFVGPLPPDIQSYITFVAGISAQSNTSDAARELITFLTSPRAIAIIKSQGMEPVSQTK
jgi:molybdate transport system substrate-binding protein